MNNAMNNNVLELKNIHRVFRQGRSELHVLKDANLSVKRGEIIALVGPSGSGKSTMLHIAGLLERPNEGDVLINGEVCTGQKDDRQTELRRKHLGFVYQYHHLLPEFSARENIIIPQIIGGMNKSDAGTRADQLLEMLGLSDRASHRPARLSGGEQQRVAIARALANAPDLLLADEPTGNLDPETANEVFKMLLGLARGAGLTAIIATHNPELAGRMDRIVRLKDGHLSED
ncbi:MAG: ABC transporter ATP-binding protein [Rhodospirillaceae bacterium]|nr:ABC transporter ATP-binding protein [Rhodospirillaceae bacterium]